MRPFRLGHDLLGYHDDIEIDRRDAGDFNRIADENRDIVSFAHDGDAREGRQHGGTCPNHGEVAESMDSRFRGNDAASEHRCASVEMTMMTSVQPNPDRTSGTDESRSNRVARRYTGSVSACAPNEAPVRSADASE